MTGDEVYDILRNVEDEPSNNGTIDLLACFIEFDLFAEVLNYAYNPFIRFHLKSDSLPGVTGQGSEEFGEEDIALLKKLASRDYSGNLAKVKVEERMKELTVKSCWLFKDILDKDLKANIGAKTINKAQKGFIPETLYMRCCLPKDVRNFKWEGAYVQEKADGMFVTITIEADNVTVMNRTGLLFSKGAFDKIEEELASINLEVFDLPPVIQLQGELLVTFEGEILPRKTGNGLLNSILKVNEAMPVGVGFVYYVWDLIGYDSLLKKIDRTPYHRRFDSVLKLCETLCHIKPISFKIVNAEEEAMDFFKARLIEGKEGAIVKERNAIWKNGTSKQQFKLKAEKECELKIKGFREGTGKNEKTFGSIICVSSDNKLEVAVAGLSDDMREYIWNDRDEYYGKTVTVRFNEVITNKTKPGKYSLFLPRFIEVREDKTDSNSLKEIKEL